MFFVMMEVCVSQCKIVHLTKILLPSILVQLARPRILIQKAITYGALIYLQGFGQAMMKIMIPFDTSALLGGHQNCPVRNPQISKSKMLKFS